MLHRHINRVNAVQPLSNLEYSVIILEKMLAIWGLLENRSQERSRINPSLGIHWSQVRSAHV